MSAWAECIGMLVAASCAVVCGYWARGWMGRQQSFAPAPTPLVVHIDAVDVANAIVRDVAELPDRDSPADWPEAMLVTQAELADILRERLGGKLISLPSTVQR